MKKGLFNLEPLTQDQQEKSVGLCSWQMIKKDHLTYKRLGM